MISTSRPGGEKLRAFSSSSATQVGEVGGGGAADRRVVERQHDDPVVVLDLAEGAADDVDDGHRRGPLAVRLEAGQQQQRLGVAAHAGGEVVEA